MTKASQEVPLAAWSLLLSQRQNFLNNNLARVKTALDQERTIELRDDLLSSVGAQDKDRNGNHMSDLDDAELYWENDQMDVYAVFRPGIETPFPHSTLDDFDMGSMAENPNLIQEEQD